MTPDPMRLAELVAARLCHDLSGPFGSLMTASELAAAEHGAGSEDPSVVAAEVAAALGRQLRLLRTAWGSDGPPIDTATFRELATGLSLGRRVRVDLSGLSAGATFSPAGARVATNVLLLGVEALAGNGVLAMAGSPEADVMVTISGPQAAWPAGLAAWLVDEDAAWQALSGPRTLQGPLTALIARRCGVRLSLMMPSGAAAGPPPLVLGFSAGG